LEIATMYAVIVCMPFVGSPVSRGCVPAASVTAIVSPIARETPSTIDAMTPERAAGSTIRDATTRLVAPTP
jgi:hypothetical protein